MALAENIKAKRLAKGMTQEELSGMVGVTKMSISRYEQGVTVPELYIALDIAKALGTTVEKLVNENFLPEETNK
ncbi:MAG: helix-turn-helix transcriptional regulator [Oscillospiraceae bacterium]|nr:helix-turn-helix transcriptional regulator [Oscillospiraceae bacterium]